MRTLLFSLLIASSASAAYQHFEARQVHPLAMTPDGTRLVAVDSANARVTVFDLTSGTPVRLSQIPVGLEPASVRARTNDELWVVNEVGDSVSILSLSAGAVVETLRVGDEPTDVVFAAGKAYVACARAGQIRVFDASTRAPAGAITLTGAYPHALTVNADGSRLYAAFLQSGNRTTVIKRQVAPPQPTPTNTALPAGPDTALIVAANDSRVTNTILDNDVAEINTATDTVVRYISDVGTILFDLVARPGSDQIWVANTESLNLTRFEPTLRGHFAESRLSIITPSLVTTVDLNPGIDYGTLPNPTAQATALAQPTSLVFSADGGDVWVAAFASDRLAKIDPVTGDVTSRVDIRTGADTNASAMRGPRGLVLDEVRGKLYSLNKLSSTLSVIDTNTLAVSSELALSSYDPMPAAIRAGRGYLFDARLSGNGTVSCGICHMDADNDGLAWDLGDPGGDMLTVLGANLSVHDTTPRPRSMHPMKGPMVTQTLRGMQNGDPFHWRGDKPTLQSFNSTFDNLMGGSQIDSEDMDDLAEYLKSLIHHSNPNRNLDRSLPTIFGSANPVTGRDLFNNHAKSHCSVCHLLPEGTDHNIDLPQESGLSQPVKTPPLRTTYQRMLFDSRAGATSISGFGMLHDGTGGTSMLPTVHPYVLSNLETVQELANVTAFIQCFDTGTARTVGYGRTVTAANRADSAVIADMTLLEARAAVNAGDCDLVVRGVIGSTPRVLRWTGTVYQNDSAAGGTMTRAALLAALSGNDAITFTGVLPGTGLRFGGDEDEDNVLNGDDPNPGIVDGPPKITEQLQSLAVVPGAPATFTVVAEGISMSYQWKRGTTNVGTNSPSFTIPVTIMGDTGSYSVVVSNAYGTRTSNVVTLNVVPPPVITKQPLGRTTNEGTNVSFSVTATGSNLSYRWKRGSTFIGGADKATLTLGGVGAQDIGSYSVVVSNGATSVTSDAVALGVNLWPVMNDLNLPDAVIGQNYSWQLSAVNAPTKFSILGLPTGLTYNPTTGLITGKPTVAKSFTVKASALNAAGNGLAKEEVMVVQSYPAAALGSYQGTVPRHSEVTLNNNLGGRLTLTTTNLGAFSGTLVLGTVSHPLKGTLVMLPDADPTGSMTIVRKNQATLNLSFRLLRASRSLTATLTDGTNPLTITAALPATAITPYVGNYTLAMKLAAGYLSNDANPRGHSIGAFKISTKGAVTGVIKLADASTAITLSGIVGEGGNLPVFSLLYARTGSLLGTLNIGAGGVLNASNLSWFKHTQTASSRSYKSSFGPLMLETIGRPYVIPPLNGIALGLTGAGEDPAACEQSWPRETDGHTRKRDHVHGWHDRQLHW
ncbi:MAG: hypothetical protein NTV80_23250 [Verrucomicrobia bacterium]|nr:hypothetical protein [Verrucomicrobiota bacterium]